ncbi:hypothetical protein WISP_142930 [Willisornis vidua]|uniref:Uncharacterized protein n=1 Tax=Willisornis vidua TaxID=1566151 RepID=A0ABQ9CLK1_9PASS|nr:hypothetical protein WISP_142930 [Willisornis vidua]
MQWERSGRDSSHGTERDGTGRNGTEGNGTGRDGTARDRTVRTGRDRLARPCRVRIRAGLSASTRDGGGAPATTCSVLNGFSNKAFLDRKLSLIFAPESLFLSAPLACGSPPTAATKPKLSEQVGLGKKS